MADFRFTDFFVNNCWFQKSQCSPFIMIFNNLGINSILQEETSTPTLSKSRQLIQSLKGGKKKKVKPEIFLAQVLVTAYFIGGLFLYRVFQEYGTINYVQLPRNIMGFRHPGNLHKCDLLCQIQTISTLLPFTEFSQHKTRLLFLHLSDTRCLHQRIFYIFQFCYSFIIFHQMF